MKWQSSFEFGLVADHKKLYLKGQTLKCSSPRELAKLVALPLSGSEIILQILVIIEFQLIKRTKAA